MRSFLVLPALALAAASLCAQQPTQNPVVTPEGSPAPNVAAAPQTNTPTVRHGDIVILQSPGSVNCPVGISARKTPQGAVVQVNRNGKDRAAGLDIQIDPLSHSAITSAEVTVTGIAGAHVLAAGENAAAPGDVSEHFTLNRSGAPRAHLRSTVYTTRITGIRFLTLDALTYADGTSWHQTAGAVCRVAPSLYLEVNAAR
jgi:hypothetical protein